MLSMGLSFSLDQRLVCQICEMGLHDHSSGCPRKSLQVIQKLRRKWSCPHCHAKRGLELNRDDYFECHDCGAVFSSSSLEGNLADSKEYYVFDDDVGVHVVRKLTLTPSGKFKHQEAEQIAWQASQIAIRMKRRKAGIDLQEAWAKAWARVHAADVTRSDEETKRLEQILKLASEAPAENN